MENIKLTSNIISGRLDPFIYAFKTNSIPDSLKVGDTYRGVETRLNEWRIKYPNLEKVYETKALINENVFFRDYSVHKYFEEDIELKRLKQEDISTGETLYSREFFRNASVDDIKAAIKNIKENYQKNNKYEYYNLETLSYEKFKFKREEVERKPRKNQKIAIDNFMSAIKSGKKKLLLYAVMRFGKTFTSLCCAKEMHAKFVVVVSAKPDVGLEWRQNVEECKNFEEYTYLDSKNLNNNYKVINEYLEQNKKIVLFLSLQDLNGLGIKAKHLQVFKNKIDLLIVDETHFGARAREYGKVLQDIETDIHYLYEIKDINKKLPAKIQLHLSGTPYRILFNNEFKEDEIICKCQYSDIINEKNAWDFKNIANEKYNEWDNPYFGFPEMVRFAFNINSSSEEKLKELKERGVNYGLSELLKSNSGKFYYEKEVLDLLKIIDGSKVDKNILSFLDNDLIKNGKLCRHIVMVLPFKDSCDAMEKLIYKNKFKNLNEYKIINVAGIEGEKKYHSPVEDAKRIITECEDNNKKTLTLTVNKMLTGTTVPEWDTMIFLKDTSSPQEYDQAIFRLQNPFIKIYKNEKGKIIKYNKKPQTILVDFSPLRMFKIEEEKCFVGNLTKYKSGNKELKSKLMHELSISPIITVNHNKIMQVEANDIIEIIGDYSNKRGILSEVNDIPIDLSLLRYKTIFNAINSQNEMTSKNALKTKGIDNTNAGDLEIDSSILGINFGKNEQDKQNNKTSENNEENLKMTLIRKFRTYYSKILFFAFLTDDKVESLDEIINVLDKEDNRRIVSNLGLEKNTLILMFKNMYGQYLRKFDYNIGRINDISTNKKYTPMERANMALNKFENFFKFSEAEIITPNDVCDKMVDLIPNSKYRTLIKRSEKILDISSTMGEFTVALYRKLVCNLKFRPNQIEKTIYSIPSSKTAYEFTRKIYKILELDTDCISKKRISYDLIKSNSSSINNYFGKKGGEHMKFDVIVGNPPYQLQGGSGGNNDAPIYQHFIEYAEKLDPTYYSLITKAAWFSAGRGNLLDDFRGKMLGNRHIQKLVVYPKSSDVFPGGTNGVEIKGGVCYLLYNKNYDGDCEYSLITGNKKLEMVRKLDSMDIFIRDPFLAKIVKKVLNKSEIYDGKTLEDVISNDTPFGIPSNPKTSLKSHIEVFPKRKNNDSILLYHIEKQQRKVEFVDIKDIKKNINDISKYKVFIPESGGSGIDSLVLGKPIVSEQNSVCSQSYLYVPFNSKEEASNFEKYLRTKFLRSLVASIKITQTATNKVYKFVPDLNYGNSSIIKWNNSIEEIDKQLYKLFDLSRDEINYIDENFKYID